MGLASLGGIPFRIDPNSVTWDFQMKVVDKPMLGGKVIQVIGTRLGDMTLTGAFGFGDRAKKDTAGWEEQDRFRDQVKKWAKDMAADRRATPIRFLYAPKKWDFLVHVKAFSNPEGENGVVHAPEVFNPKWQLTLFVVQDRSGVVVKGIRDLYIQRLMEGVGWKQTEYNGPTEAEVSELLSPFGGDFRAYMKDQFAKAVQGTLADSATGPGGAAGAGGSAG